MADKSKTIKSATDKELDDLITRLRKENELQFLLTDLKRMGSSVEIPYNAACISTEVPIGSLYHEANKLKSIKDLTDAELDEALTRLRKERELQSLVVQIKQRSSDGSVSYELPQVSTEQPIESLYHYGILGMKWGHRHATERSSGKNAKKNKNDEPATGGSEDHLKSRALKRKGVTNLSTPELKELTSRLQLEKQYKELDPRVYNKGLNYVKTITAVGTTLASLYALTKTPLAQDIKKGITTAINASEESDKIKWVL